LGKVEKGVECHIHRRLVIGREAEVLVVVGVEFWSPMSHIHRAVAERLVEVQSSRNCIDLGVVMVVGLVRVVLVVALRWDSRRHIRPELSVGLSMVQVDHMHRHGGHLLIVA